MTTPTYTPLDIVNFASNKDAVNIQTAFDQMIGQKVYDAIQQRKIEIAQTMFNPPAEDEEQSTEASAEEQDQGAVDQQPDQETEESEESHEDAEQHA